MKVQKKHKTKYIECMKPQKSGKKEEVINDFSIIDYVKIIINKLKL